MTQPRATTLPQSRADLAALPADEQAAEALEIVLWPDPRLRRKCLPIAEFDTETVRRLTLLADRMFAIMREEKGVGLAGPQVGVNVQIFVMNPTRSGKPDGDRIYINPQLSEPDGEDELEEGCLSLPDINTPVLRSLRLRINARTLTGDVIDETAEGFAPRVWQHETDHLNGILILDKMPPSIRMSHRKELKNLEDDYTAAHPLPEKSPRRAQRARRKKL